MGSFNRSMVQTFNVTGIVQDVQIVQQRFNVQPFKVQRQQNKNSVSVVPIVPVV